jgi:hypothetical protein
MRVFSSFSGMGTGTSLTWTDREAIPANALIARGLGKPWKHQGASGACADRPSKTRVAPTNLGFR